MPHIDNFFGTPLFPANYLRFLLIGVVFSLLSIYVAVHRKYKHFRDELRSFIVLSFIFGSLIGCIGLVAAGFMFIPKPEVVSVTPTNASENIETNSTIEIKFSRPVRRRIMQKTITPDVAGVWVFEDPVYTTHLYRKLVFYPDTTFDSDTNYKVNISGIGGHLRGIFETDDYEFTFTTKKDEQVAVEVAKKKIETVKLSVPVLLQQHTLSCELSSLKMTLLYKGIAKSEEELLAQVGVDHTPHSNGIWGNPYEQFVGNVDGSQMRDGYGVYWGPIERVAKMYGGAQAFQNGNVSMLTSNILQGNPIIIWVYSSGGRPTSWKTPSGVNVYAVSGEHTVVMVGYVGDPSNPSQIIVNDPLVGQVYWSRSLFDRKWASFSQSGVVVYK